MKIRPYEHKDLVQCEAGARWFQESSLFNKAGWDSAKFKKLADLAADPNSNVFAQLAETDGIIVGAFVGRITEYYFSREKLAEDLIVIFLPEYRKEAYESLTIMLRHFEAWAKSKGAIEVCIGASTALKNDNYKKFLLKENYQDVGFIVKKGV